MADRTRIELLGDKALRRAFESLGKPSSVRKVLRPSVRAALSPVNKAAKSLAPKKSRTATGALRASIGIRKAIFGRTFFSQTVGARGGGKFARPDPFNKRRARRPEFYAWLVEHGSTKWGGHPHLKLAFDSKLSAMKSTLDSKVRVELPKEVRRQRLKAGGPK